MGKRKSSTKAAPKKAKEPLATTFKCLFCNHDKTVMVKLKTMFGHLNCKDCGQKFSTPINAHVDVYADWVDACEEIRAKQPPKARIPRPVSPLAHGFAGGARLNLQSNQARARNGARAGEGVLDEDEDDDLDEDDLDAPIDAPDARRESGRGGARDKDRDLLDDVDDEDEDEEGARDREQDRRKRVRRDDPDDDDDEDD